MRVTVITGLLAFRLLLRIKSRHSLVQRGLAVQEFVAREIWDEWDALVSHRGADITSQQRGSVEVKYFFWNSRRFSQTVRGAITQHHGRVARLVLVSSLIIHPARDANTDPYSLKRIIQNSYLGVVICEMSEVTEDVRPVKMWSEVLQEVISQLPPNHEFAGLTPEELMEYLETYLMQQLALRQERLEERQERLEERQERLEEHLKRLEKTITDGFKVIKEELKSMRASRNEND